MQWYTPPISVCTRLIILLLLGMMCQPTYATTSSRIGGSGMSWMRTGDTLSNGELVLYDQFGIDTYVILNSNLSDYDLFNTLGVNYGMFDSLELGLETTYLSNDQHGSSGIRSYKGILKFRILGDKIEDGYAVTLSGFKTLSPAAKSKMIGSGKSESGAEINASYFGNDINLHLNLGSATSDAKYYDPDVVYYSVEKQYANFGAEFKVSHVFTFGIEAIKERSDNVEFDQNTLYAFSLQYKPDKTWNFDFGAAFGVPEDRSEPAKSFYVGINYRIGGKDQPVVKKRPVIQQKPVQQPQSIPVPETKPAAKPAFSKRTTTPQAKPKRQEKLRKNYKYTVRLKNASGSAAIAKRVADFLRENGYGVKSIATISKRSKTEIRYLNRNSKQALRLALKLPGNQDLRKMTNLSSGVDFEIIIGNDMVKNIR